MNVLIINSVVGSGSTGNLVAGLYHYLKTKGHIVKIGYGIGEAKKVPKEDTFKVNNRLGYYIHNLLSRFSDGAGFYSNLQTNRFIRYIKKIQPDVIHIHTLHGYWINIRVLFSFLKDYSRPVIWTLHDCWSFTGHCTHFVSVECEKWRIGCFECPLRDSYPKSYVDFSHRNYTLKRDLYSFDNKLYIVPVSDWLAGFVKGSFLNRCNITVIKNGIDLTLFKPYGYVSDSKIRVLGVASVWNKDKGLQDFYRLRELLSPDDVEIMLVGLSKEQLDCLPKGIVGIEHTESLEKLVAVFSSASVFVNPTYADTFPTVNIEALACGTPVITYRTGGSPEAVSSQTGWVVDPGDIKGIAIIVQSLLQEGIEGIMARRVKCRERIINEFDMVKCYESYLRKYEDVLL